MLAVQCNLWEYLEDFQGNSLAMGIHHQIPRPSADFYRARRKHRGKTEAGAGAPVSVGVLLDKGHDPDSDLEAHGVQLAHHAGRVWELERIKLEVPIRRLPPVVYLHHRPLRSHTMLSVFHPVIPCKNPSITSSPP